MFAPEMDDGSRQGQMARPIVLSGTLPLYWDPAGDSGI